MHQSYSSVGIYVTSFLVFHTKVTVNIDLKHYHVWKQAIYLPVSSPSRKKHMPSPGFEPWSPRPRSKSDDFNRSAMGPPGAKISNGASLQFAGYDWDIKDSGGAAVGPGPNVFDPSLAFTDGHGMHLNLRPRSGCAGWASSEVLLSRSLGYGTYLFSVVGPAQTLDAQCVFGAFLWDDNAAPGYREIDFEFARWGNPGDPTAAQFVLEPLRSNKLPAWRVRYPLGAAARYSEAQPDGPAEEVNRLTCALVWGPGRLEWYCWDGLWTLATVGQATVSMVGLYTNARGF